LALALALFGDASRVRFNELAHDGGTPTRLLGIGLPLSIALGGVLAAVVFDSLPWALAGLIGAALAPTDAALSVQVINDRRIPVRVRRTLNVESGLNDGIATPVVTFMIASAASQLGLVSESVRADFGAAVRELLIGVVVGVVVGGAAAAGLAVSVRRGWTADAARLIATTAAAVAALALALQVDGNGFIAAFVGGLTFGGVLARSSIDAAEVGELTDLGAELLALVVWFLFGATLVPVALEHLDMTTFVYAVCSLTVIRMLPALLSLVGTGLGRRDRIVIAWFGPRGLASVVFAILAIEELGTAEPVVVEAVGVIAFTVLASVVMHGVTAGVAGSSYVTTDSGRDTSTAGTYVDPEIGTSDALRARRRPLTAAARRSSSGAADE
jgi:NhaP-type Na+/H+ or K+/H+ antiporter